VTLRIFSLLAIFYAKIKNLRIYVQQQAAFVSVKHCGATLP
jgi:hypothetical protein